MEEKSKQYCIIFAFFIAIGIYWGGLWNKNVKTLRHVLKCHHIVYLVDKTTNVERPNTLNEEVQQDTTLLLVAVLLKPEYVYKKTGTLYEDFKQSNVKLLYFTTESSIVAKSVDVTYIENGNETDLTYLNLFTYVSKMYDKDFKWFLFTDGAFFFNIDKLVSYIRKLDNTRQFILQQEVHKTNRKSVALNEDIREDSKENRTSVIKSKYKGRNELGLVKLSLSSIIQAGTVISQMLLRRLAREIVKSCSMKSDSFTSCQQTVSILMNDYSNDAEVTLSKYNNACEQDYKDVTSFMVAFDLSKNMKCLHRARVQLLTEKVRSLSRKNKRLQRKLNDLKWFIDNSENQEISTRSLSRVQKVERSYMFTQGKHFIPHNKGSWSLRSHSQKQIARVIDSVMNKIRDAHLNESIHFDALHYGYLIEQPINGLEYRFNIFTTNHRRHLARTKQEFGAIQSRTIFTPKETTVNVVVPLAGRFENFQLFLLNLERNILKQHERITITVVNFPEIESPQRHIKLFNRYNRTYPKISFHWLNLTGKFSRAMALQAAVDFHKHNGLLFFADVDLNFNNEFLHRCRYNTVAKKQVYFPVMFKTFNANITGTKMNSTKYFILFDRKEGDWAMYSYGPVCAYRDDIISVGGLNVHIKEWGFEDIQLFEAFLSKHFHVIRVADPGLWHIYHTHTSCKDIHSSILRVMCKGALLDSLASVESIVEYLQTKRFWKEDVL